MLGRSHFGGREHTQLLLHALHPGQSLLTVTLEATGFGAGLPDACAEYLDAVAAQLLGRGHNLFFTFGTARACDYQRTLVSYAGEVEFFNFE